MTFSQYYESIADQYDFIKKHAKKSGDIAGYHLEDLTDTPWIVLKEQVPELLKDGRYEEAILLLLEGNFKDVKRRKVLKSQNSQKLTFIMWVFDQYHEINEMEGKYLYSTPDPKMMQAGIHELDPLGDVNLIDSLSDGDILKWDSIKKMRYSVIFDKRLKNTIEARINKRLIDLNKSKK